MGKKRRACMTLCRPPFEAFEIMRRMNGRWAKDNGEPGRAFSYQDAKGFPMAGAVACSCSMFDGGCQLGQAMRLTAQRWKCANGEALRPTRTEIPEGER